MATYRQGALLRGKGVEEEIRLRRERDGRDSLVSTTDCSVDPQDRTTFFKPRHFKPKLFIFRYTGSLVDACSRMLEKEDWALAVGVGRVWVTERSSRGNTWEEGFNTVENLQREREGASFLRTTARSVDQQHTARYSAS